MPKINGKHVGDTVGTFKDYGGGTVINGYLRSNGDTIGSAASGANYFDAKYKLLFVFLWTEYDNTRLIIQTSGGVNTTRGASADADFAANKRMPLPDWRRRASVGAGSSGTGTLGNTLGDTGGEENHTLSTGEMPSHSHGVSQSPHTHSPGIGAAFVVTGAGGAAYGNGGGFNDNFNAAGATAGANANVSIQSAGSGSSHNNIQPSFIVTKVIKY